MDLFVGLFLGLFDWPHLSPLPWGERVNGRDCLAPSPQSSPAKGEEGDLGVSVCKFGMEFVGALLKVPPVCT